MKYTRLSLVAIMALGSFSVSNAGSIEDAIKGADIAGYGRLRLDNTNGGAHGNQSTKWQYYLETNLKTAKTDGFQGTIRVKTLETDDDADGHADYHTNEDNKKGSSRHDLQIDKIYLEYTGVENLTVVGGVKSSVGVIPWGDVSNGNAVGVTYNMGGFNVDAALITSHSDGYTVNVVTDGNDTATVSGGSAAPSSFTTNTGKIYAVGTDYSSDMFNAKFAYAQVSGIDEPKGLAIRDNNGTVTKKASRVEPTFMFVSAGTSVPLGGLKLGATFMLAQADIGKVFSGAKSQEGDSTLLKISADTGSIGTFEVGYTEHGKDGAGVMNLDGDLSPAGDKRDGDVKNTTYTWAKYDIGVAGGDLGLTYVMIDTTPKKAGTGDNVTYDGKTGIYTEESEILVTYSYPVTKALSATVKVSQLAYKKHGTIAANEKQDGQDFGRFELKYSF